MAFYNSCRDVELNGSTLSAQCQSKEGYWGYSEIDLNDYIGNREGYFDTRTDRFYETATDVYLEGSVLHADMKDSYGYYQGDQTIDLNLFITNDDGQLKFKQYM